MLQYGTKSLPHEDQPWFFTGFSLGLFSQGACVLIPVILCSWLFIGIEDIRAQDYDIADTTGERIYRLHCLRCHGARGDGRGPDSPSLIVPPGDFHSPESTAKSEIELRTIIIWGIVFSPMHGWWDRLTSEDIRAVIDYIRLLAPYQPRI